MSQHNTLPRERYTKIFVPKCVFQLTRAERDQKKILFLLEYIFFLFYPPCRCVISTTGFMLIDTGNTLKVSVAGMNVQCMYSVLTRCMNELCVFQCIFCCYYWCEQEITKKRVLFILFDTKWK